MLPLLRQKCLPENSHVMKERFVLGHNPRVRSFTYVERCQEQEAAGLSLCTSSQEEEDSEPQLLCLLFRALAQDSSVSLHLLSPVQRILTGMSEATFPG